MIPTLAYYIGFTCSFQNLPFFRSNGISFTQSLWLMILSSHVLKLNQSANGDNKQLDPNNFGREHQTVHPMSFIMHSLNCGRTTLDSALDEWTKWEPQYSSSIRFRLNSFRKMDRQIPLCDSRSGSHFERIQNGIKIVSNFFNLQVS